MVRYLRGQTRAKRQLILDRRQVADPRVEPFATAVRHRVSTNKVWLVEVVEDGKVALRAVPSIDASQVGRLRTTRQE